MKTTQKREIKHLQKILYYYYFKFMQTRFICRMIVSDLGDNFHLQLDQDPKSSAIAGHQRCYIVAYTEFIALFPSFLFYRGERVH